MESEPSRGEPPADGAPAAERRRLGRAARSWAGVLVGAAALAVGLRACVAEAYRIPTPSMEATLLVGDLVLVEKLTYGARLFGRRAPGLRGVRHGDVVVFNYPPGREARVAARLPYIKRAVGLPGDTVEIVAREVRVGGVPQAAPAAGRRFWAARTGGPPPDSAALAAAGVAEPPQRLAPGVWLVVATPAEAARLGGLEPVVRPPGDGSAPFPTARRYSLDHFGPVVVPRAGVPLPLTDATWAAWRVALERDEGRRVERLATGFLVDGQPADSVTFRQDYLFVLGDFRDDSADSRTWGFVPMGHVIGRAALVYASFDPDTRRLRLDRVGRIVR